MSIHISKPGKLYLAGEYAVLSGQSKAIIMQTKAKLHVTIKKDTRFLVSDANQKLSMSFESYDELILNLSEPYLKEAIAFCHEYLGCLGKKIKPFHLSIESDLKVDGLEKLGLGSSAALTVASIDACLRFHDVMLDNMSLYKAGVLTQIKNYPHSSFGDIACSAYDHAIIYQKFDENWLFEHRDTCVNQLISLSWPNLEITPIDMPKLPILFIYTNQPANSQVLVKTIQEKTDASFYEAWNKKTGKKVSEMIKHLKEVNIFHLMQDIDALNEGLKDLCDHSNIPLFTKTMAVIQKEVIKAQGVFKFSGAGGGDCVITLFKDDNDLNRFKEHHKDTYHIINDMIEGLN